MIKLMCVLFVMASANGHNGNLQKDSALQSDLMPQELNPVFVPDTDAPWKEIMPVRLRRDTNTELESVVTLDRLKTYSRVVACVVLAVSAAVEIVVYLVEMYSAS